MYKYIDIGIYWNDRSKVPVILVDWLKFVNIIGAEAAKLSQLHAVTGWIELPEAQRNLGIRISSCLNGVDVI